MLEDTLYKCVVPLSEQEARYIPFELIEFIMAPYLPRPSYLISSLLATE